MKRWMLGGVLAFAVATPCLAVTVDVGPYARNDSVDTIKLSPNGDYYATVVPMEGKSVLLIVHRADNKQTGTFNLGAHTYIADFDWVSPTRIIISTGRKFGALDQPELTGNLYGINADGSGAFLLVGPDVSQMSTGSHIQTRVAENASAFLVDDLPGDDRNVLVAISPMDADAFSRVDRMDVDSGKRIPVVHAPVRNAVFKTDHKGVVRFASGFDKSGIGHLYVRAGDKTEWSQINNELSDDHREWPLGFSADDRTAYLGVGQQSGPDAIVAMDMATGTRKQVFRDADNDPDTIIRDVGGSVIGATIMGAKPRTIFFDPGSTDARLYRSLEAAFPNDSVEITSTTTDGHLVVVGVSSDRNPGDFYLFDTVAKKADLMISRRDWFDPANMSDMRSFDFKARDGMKLYGYLTMPRGPGKNLPMVVLPHGGPFGLYDTWGFNPETQLLAAAGYAVLQVNYRGSGGHGQAYQRAGARQWGLTIQDDITDATRWAVAQGIADGQRICIYGGSYGGYAALMGAAKEPGLYKCAVGYAGVYDLPLVVNSGGLADSSQAYLERWVGKPASLITVSPTNLAKQIKAPVFLAAGGQDETAPITHSERMEKALRAAGVPVETLYIRTEGHGFYVDEHRKQFYNQLLGFLDRNIGAGAAGSKTAAAGASAAPATPH